MADRPILMSAPMVLACLREAEVPGTGKTQTRRILKVLNASMLDAAERDGGKCLLQFARFAKGDRLWCRETWRTEARYDSLKPSDISPAAIVSYDADYSAEPNDGCRGKTRVAIHMPRWASRLTLTVTDVRVQRLQAISHGDAVAEGIERRMVECADGVSRAMWFGMPHVGNDADPVRAYADLWDGINNARGLCADDEPKGWAANPWICAVSFSVERRNIDS